MFSSSDLGVKSQLESQLGMLTFQLRSKLKFVSKSVALIETLEKDEVFMMLQFPLTGWLPVLVILNIEILI